MSLRKAFNELRWGIDCDMLLATSMTLLATQNRTSPYNPAWITYVTGFTAICAAAHGIYSLYQDYSSAKQTWQFYRANAVTPQNTTAPAAPSPKPSGR